MLLNHEDLYMHAVHNITAPKDSLNGPREIQTKRQLDDKPEATNQGLHFGCMREAMALTRDAALSAGCRLSSKGFVLP